MVNGRKLPVGIQDFEDLRTTGNLYVDKTAYIYRLVTMGKPYFLGRPRRFGKSLLLSTLKAYFLGKKELFEGLAIANLEKEWIEYPVIYIDFNLGSADNLQTVQNLLSSILDRYEHQWGIVENHDDLPLLVNWLISIFRKGKVKKQGDLSVRFFNLIETAYEKSGKKVVVLVDEYDKALTHTMDKPETHEELRTFLKGFYGVLKGMDYALRFVFLTGVTKFSKVSVFSDLNHLTDISLYDDYAVICGISETELINCFEPEINALAVKIGKTYHDTLGELRKHYNGYHFSEHTEGIYNPYSLLRTFAEGKIRDYWFETGTPTFLVKMLKNIDFDLKNLENDVKIQVRSISDYTVGSPNPVPLLYQSGYLTIKSYDASFDAFTLGFPNEEVKYGFLNELLPAYIPKWGLDESFSVIAFVTAVRSGKVNDFMNLLKAYYASISYDLEDNIDKDEKYFQLIFYLLFTNMGQFIQTEVKCATGRADAVVKTADSIYVFEFKMGVSHPLGKAAEEALQQIDAKGYLIPYIADERRIVKIGVEFSKVERGIKRWVSKG